MPLTQPEYVAAVDLTVTSWGSALLTDEIGSSAAVDGGTLVYADTLLGGILESGTSPAAGGTMDVYVTSQYDEGVSAAYAGGIDGGITGLDEELTEDTEVQLAALKLFASILAITVLGIRFGGKGINQYFGGFPPETWVAILHNNTSVTMTAGSAAAHEGIKWSSGN